MTSVLGIARADFTERSRRFSFIALMAAALFAAFLFVPRGDDSIHFMVIEPEVIVQGGNASWIPVAGAWGLGFLLPLIGFFYLRNAVAFDEKTGVNQLISTSPVGNIRYMLGKFISGTLILYCAALVVMLGSFIVAVWKFPGQWLTPYDFLSPFVFLITALPFCAALAVLFESIRFLRGAVGSVIFVMGFTTLISLLTLGYSELQQIGFLAGVFDISGMAVIYPGIGNAVFEASGRPLGSLTFLGGGTGFDGETATKSLVFHGLPVTAADLIRYATQLGLTLVTVLVSAQAYAVTENRINLNLIKKKRDARSTDNVESVRPVPEYKPIANSNNKNWLCGVQAELRLMLNGQTLAWKLVALGGLVACAFADFNMVQTYLIPLLIVWFVNIFAAMGSREHQHKVLGAISVIPGGRLKQICCSWISGLIIMLVLFLPAAVRMAVSGQLPGLFAGLSGAVFLPSFAMFLGCVTKTRRVFELLFILMTYLAVNDAAVFMYMGGSTFSLTRAVVYLVVGIAMAVAAVVKRNCDITV